MLSERDAIGFATLFAYVNKRSEAVDFLLEKDGNWNMIGVNNGTLLHRAAWEGDLPMLQRLVAKGADIENRANPFVSTPLSWAQHNKQTAVVEWMRSHCRVDLHDAVGFGFREHVEARLREDPASMNMRRDHWDIPACTALHWAAWTQIEDVDGPHAYDPATRAELVTLLLDHGADPNVVSGNGYTPLDVADAAPNGGAIVALLERRGGKRAKELPSTGAPPASDR